MWYSLTKQQKAKLASEFEFILIGVGTAIFLGIFSASTAVDFNLNRFRVANDRPSFNALSGLTSAQLQALSRDVVILLGWGPGAGANAVSEEFTKDIGIYLSRPGRQEFVRILQDLRSGREMALTATIPQRPLTEAQSTAKAHVFLIETLSRRLLPRPDPPFPDFLAELDSRASEKTLADLVTHLSAEHSTRRARDLSQITERDLMALSEKTLGPGLLGWAVSADFHKDVFEGWARGVQEEFAGLVEDIFDRRGLGLGLDLNSNATADLGILTLTSAQVASSSKETQLNFTRVTLTLLLPRPPTLELLDAVDRHTRATSRRELVTHVHAEFARRSARIGSGLGPNPNSNPTRLAALSDGELIARASALLAQLGWTTSPNFRLDLDREWPRAVREEFIQNLDAILFRRRTPLYRSCAAAPPAAPAPGGNANLGMLEFTALAISELVGKDASKELKEQLESGSYGETRDDIFEALRAEWGLRQGFCGQGAQRAEDLAEPQLRLGARVHFLALTWLNFGRQSSKGTEIGAMLITMLLLAALNVVLYYGIVENRGGLCLVWLIAHPTITALIISYGVGLMWRGAPVIIVIFPVFAYTVARLSVLYHVLQFVYEDPESRAEAARLTPEPTEHLSGQLVALPAKTMDKNAGELELPVFVYDEPLLRQVEALQTHAAVRRSSYKKPKNLDTRHSFRAKSHAATSRISKSPIQFH